MLTDGCILTDGPFEFAEICKMKRAKNTSENLRCSAVHLNKGILGKMDEEAGRLKESV
jgi:hypothetical protein